MRRGTPALSPEERRRRNRAILAAYCNEERVQDIAARFGVTGRMVAKLAEQADLSRPRGRPAIWPECPPEHRQTFRYLRHRIPVAEARAEIEREIGA